MTVPMETLNPAIVDIGPDGLTVSCTATGPQLGLNEPEDKFQGPLAIQIELVQSEGPISVTGTLEGTAIRQCVRCLVEYSDPLFVTLYAEYLPQVGAVASLLSPTGADERFHLACGLMDCGRVSDAILYLENLWNERPADFRSAFARACASL